MQRGDIHVIGNTKTEITIVQAYIGDDSVGRVIGEPAPETGVEIDGIGFIGTGWYPKSLERESGGPPPVMRAQRSNLVVRAHHWRGCHVATLLAMTRGTCRASTILGT